MSITEQDALQHFACFCYAFQALLQGIFFFCTTCVVNLLQHALQEELPSKTFLLQQASHEIEIEYYFSVRSQLRCNKHFMRCLGVLH